MILEHQHNDVLDRIAIFVIMWVTALTNAFDESSHDLFLLVVVYCPQTSYPMTILFLHGWQSVPGGVKPTYLKDHGHTVITPKLPDEDFTEAVRIAQAEFDKHKPDVELGLGDAD